ncbi:MAG TPA: lipoate--protein ligase family protein [bacterium]|nr:lipoate--protein ligase family protein [bacterium]
MAADTLRVVPTLVPPADILPDPITAQRWAARNIAADEALLVGLGDGSAGPTFRTYVNPPCVVLGLSRRIARDVHRDTCAALGVPVLRRASGGGTVYHDAGTLNLAWVLPWQLLPPGCGPKSLTDGTTDFFLEILANALGTLGFAAIKTRISDLSIGDPPRKVAGSGQARKAAGVLHHVSLLVAVDIDRMAQVLPNPPDRPDRDHRDFVTSLADAGFKALGGLPGGRQLVAETVAMATQNALGLNAMETTLDSGATLCRQVEALLVEKYLREEWIARL